MTSPNPVPPPAQAPFIGRYRPIFYLALAGLFLLGLGIRFTNLTNPPLEFHPTRQLRSAIIARAIYYQMLPSADPTTRQMAIQLWSTLENLEPPNFERLVALTYLAAGGEYLWIPRVYSIIFWMIGGLVLFDLARRMISRAGALVTLGYYLLLPFGAIVSRTFQPDSLMVMGIILSAWAIYRWSESPTWRWAILAGLLSGLTMFIKITAIFPLAPIAAATVLSRFGLRSALRNRQVWVMAFIMGIIPWVYYIGTIGSSSAGHFEFWSLSFAGLLLKPRFYVLWLNLLSDLMSLAVIVIGLVGIMLFSRITQRMLVLGWWVGYALYGFAFPYHIHTHEYYSLMLVPAIALSLAPVGELIINKVTLQPRVWQVFTLAALFLAIAYPSWIAYTGIKGVNYRDEILGWIKMGKALPSDGSIIALTHDYGFRVEYYGWHPVSYWPTSIDFNMDAERGDSGSPNFEQMFKEKTAGKDYFLVTLFGELDAQPALKDRLYNNYPIYAQGDGYVLFDLRHPKNP